MRDVHDVDPLARPTRWVLFAGTGLALLFAWGLDFVATGGLRNARYDWMVPLISGPVLAVLLVRPRRLALEKRAALAAAGSLLVTALMLVDQLEHAGFGASEAAGLLVMLVLTARLVRRIRTAVLAGLGLVAALLVVPVRLADASSLAYSYGLAFAAAAAIGLGGYLRVRDWQRVRTLESVRNGERMELARDLHDFVAHHVTGIIVQANAARAIRETAPEQIDPILDNISRAGSETLESMRRLVRVLREVDGDARRSSELVAELAKLVSGFCGPDEQDATLTVAAPARTARLAPEVETSVHRLVQEALTNVRRHAPGAGAQVRVGVAEARLCVEVRNSAPAAARPAAPVGGFGLAGLRERVEAVDGTLEAGGLPDGGWRVSGTFPVLAMAGSAA